MACTREALLQKLAWASAELGSSTSLETSIQLCSLIRACAEALRSLQQLQPYKTPPEKNPLEKQLFLLCGLFFSWF